MYVFALIGAVVLGMLWAYGCLREYKNIRFGNMLSLIILILIGGGFTLYHMGQEKFRCCKNGWNSILLQKLGEKECKWSGPALPCGRIINYLESVQDIGERHYYGQYRPSDIHEEGHSMPHNMPLFFLSTGGLVGVAGYCIFIILSIVALTKVVKMWKISKMGYCSLHDLSFLFLWWD